MSYILKALRKAELERQRGEIPGVHSPQPPAAADVAFRGRRWVAPLLVLNLTVLMALAVFYLSRPAQQSLRQVSVAAPVPLVDYRPIARDQKPAVISTGNEGQEGEGAEVDFSAEVASAAVLPPAQSYDQYPGLSMSMHFYSAQQSRSMVRINGTVARSGDRVAPDFFVEQIAADGVFLRNGDISFFLKAGR